MHYKAPKSELLKIEREWITFCKKYTTILKKIDDRRLDKVYRLYKKKNSPDKMVSDDDIIRILREFKFQKKHLITDITKTVDTEFHFPYQKEYQITEWLATALVCKESLLPKLLNEKNLHIDRYRRKMTAENEEVVLRNLEQLVRLQTTEAILMWQRIYQAYKALPNLIRGIGNDNRESE